MKTRGLKQGFTLVELLIVVAILAILSGAAYIGIMRSQARVMNEKVLDDLIAISNALEQYKQDAGHYPTINAPLALTEDKNVSCFKADTTYSHDCAPDKGAAFLQTQVDNLLLTKRYLQEVPTDPRTHSRYIYGVTTDGNYYQVAGNYLDENDIWIAKVRGNVEKGYRLPSLIRAFDGANFVMDGETYLPYSPDHLSLTARVVEQTGNSYIDDMDVDENNNLAKPGSTVKADPGAIAVLYFSDGSVTYLDGNPDGAKLRVLPTTEVQQNDEDGIITKIRLKLFSGKIWSKVARLAQKSEFNVETTSAIAGVRGTEFGINADSTELIVLSGTVVARGLTAEEQHAAAETDGFQFSALPEAEDFTEAQVITGNGDYTQYPVPAPAAAAPATGQLVTDLTVIDNIEENYYEGAFNNNYHPRVLEVDTTAPPNQPKIVFEYVAGVDKINTVEAGEATDSNVITSWQGPSQIIVDADETTLTVTPLLSYFDTGKMVRFYFENQTSGERTGLSEPAIFIGPDIQLAEDDIYNEPGETPSDVGQEVGAGGDNVTSIEITGLPEVPVEGRSYPFTIMASTGTGSINVSDSTTCISYQDISLPKSGDTFMLTIPNGVLGEATLTCNHNDGATNTADILIISKAAEYCYGPNLVDNGGENNGDTTDDNGYWDGEACWVLGEAGDNCDVTCDVKANALCVDSSDGDIDWNDEAENQICLILAGIIQPPLSPPPLGKGEGGSTGFFAPYFQPGLNWCYTRKQGLSIDPNLCGTTQNISGQNRVCRCN